MGFLEFLKEKWNLALGLALAIVVVLMEFIVRPKLSYFIAEGGMNYQAFSRFIVTGLILLLLLPCSVFRHKKHMWIWWSAAIVTFIGSFILLFSYNNALNRKSAYNSFTDERVVIGDQLLPLAQQAVDSARLREGIQLTTSDILETMGEPRYIWPPEEIEANSRAIIWFYIVTLISFSLFILFSIQAIYCATAQS